jgi:hypothetical protein
MWGHLHWHAALAELDLDRQDAALRRCVGPIMSYLTRGSPFMGLADATTVLWRLALRGERELPWARVSTMFAAISPMGRIRSASCTSAWWPPCGATRKP